MSIRNFINLLLPRAERNDSESYAECLYAYYTDNRLIQKLMVDPLLNYGVGYTMGDKYVLSYVPRLLPDDTAVIAQEHITDGIQAVLKADYMLALNSGNGMGDPLYGAPGSSSPAVAPAGTRRASRRSAPCR